MSDDSCFGCRFSTSRIGRIRFNLSPMRNVLRYAPEGRPVFLTLRAAAQQRHFSAPETKTGMMKILQHTRDQQGAHVYAWVILDDHVHLLLRAPSDRFAAFVSAWKLCCQGRIAAFARRSPFQPGFCDHIIRDERDFHARLDYIHYNPVKHGYVHAAADYQWSSMVSFVRRGHYPCNWGALGTPRTIREDTGNE